MSKPARKRKKQRARSATPSDSDAPRRRFRFSAVLLEIARGHDGLLRGKPEPAVLIAVYRTHGPQPASLAARFLVRASLTGNIPCTLPLTQPEIRYDARFAPNERILVLALALEEDSGEAVRALYTAFATPAAFLVYGTSDPVPNPLSLDEWQPPEGMAAQALPVEIMFDGANCAEIAGSDQFIAACALSVSSQARAAEVWRLPFIASDERNHWTLSLRVRSGA